MSDIGVTVADGEDALSRWVEFRNALIPDWPLTLEDVLHDKATNPHRAELTAVAADGVTVGGGAAARRLYSGGSDVFVNVWVPPGHRRHGVGTAILRSASEFARGWNATELEGYVDEREDAGIAFAERHGFREVGRDLQVALDLATAEAPDVRPPEGIEIVTLAERPDVLRGVYEVEQEAVPDIPGAAPQRLPDFELWHTREVETPNKRLDAWFVALADDQVVGHAVLDVTADGDAWHDMTGVRRSWRGRGVGGALKRAQIQWAKHVNLSRLVTDNHEDNAPIRHLNAVLGYRPEAARITMRGPLAP